MSTDFKLLTNEAYALTQCGCEVERLKPGEFRLTYCPTHAAAPALLEALEEARGFIEELLADYVEPDLHPMETHSHLRHLNRAINSARGIETPV